MRQSRSHPLFLNVEVQILAPAPLSLLTTSVFTETETSTASTPISKRVCFTRPSKRKRKGLSRTPTMARQKPPKPLTATLSPKTLILDNGAHTIKAGYSTLNATTPPPGNETCRTIPNTIVRSQRDKRTYIGSELHDCVDFGELAFKRPVEKGYVVSWESQKAIWENEFFDPANKESSDVYCPDPSETNLVLTEAPNAPAALQKHCDEMVFEEFGFGNYWRTVAPVLSAYGVSPFEGGDGETESGKAMECALIVDVGYSHSTVTPMFQGRALQGACKRLEVGGKTLTNQLKDLVSTRQFELRKEDWMANQIKEDVCFVSLDFENDLERTWKGGSRDRREIDHSIVLDYVLPDYEDIKRGFARAHDPGFNARKRQLGIGGPREDILVLANERFTVPELLFTPSDIGMQSEGLVGTILQSLDALPKGLWQTFLANVVVIGGTSKLPGLVQRLEADLRMRLPETFVVRVGQPEDPIKHAWSGGARLAQNEEAMKQLVVSKQEYMEHGDVWVRRKFAGKLGR
jgi:actin-related protein 6